MCYLIIIHELNCFPRLHNVTKFSPFQTNNHIAICLRLLHQVPAECIPHDVTFYNTKIVDSDVDVSVPYHNSVLLSSSQILDLGSGESGESGMGIASNLYEVDLDTTSTVKIIELRQNVH